MREGASYLYRAAALVLALVAVVFFAARLAEEPVQALQKPQVRPAPEAFEKASARKGRGRAGLRCGGSEDRELRGA